MLPMEGLVTTVCIGLGTVFLAATLDSAACVLPSVTLRKLSGYKESTRFIRVIRANPGRSWRRADPGSRP